MDTSLEERSFSDRLEFRLTQRESHKALLLRAAIWMAAIIAIVLVRPGTAVFWLWCAGLASLCAVMDIARTSRATDVTFTVTERDIRSEGYTRDEYQPINRLRKQAPDLAWRNERSDEGGPIFPNGVYCGNDCVLPLVTMEEGHRIIEAIYTRFPDTASESSSDGRSKASPIITLGLFR